MRTELILAFFTFLFAVVSSIPTGIGKHGLLGSGLNGLYDGKGFGNYGHGKGKGLWLGGHGKYGSKYDGKGHSNYGLIGKGKGFGYGGYGDYGSKYGGFGWPKKLGNVY